MTHWLEEAVQAGLERIDSNELIEFVARHNLVEDRYRAERARKRISPSLIAEECRLARLKRFRKHDPQPGWKWGAVRSGRPSAGSNLHFMRGYFGEGWVVAALSRVGRSYQVMSENGEQETREGLGLYPFDVLGVSPWAAWEAEVALPLAVAGGQPSHATFLAYPDLILATSSGIELVQVKCPSVFAFDRYRRDRGASMRKRYEPQAVTEMYVGRQLGLPIERNHILAVTWEGFLPGSDEAREGKEIRVLPVTVDWQDGMDRFVESVAEEILEDDAAADRGNWPVPYPAGTKWPCDYCNYPRVSDGESAGCEEHEKWEPQSRSSATSPNSPPPSAVPPPLPASTRPAASSAPPPLPPSSSPPPLPS